jgi:hypothetical protein
MAMGTHFAIDEDDMTQSDAETDVYAVAKLWNDDRMREDDAADRANGTNAEPAGNVKAVDTLLDGGDTRAYTQHPSQ